MDSQRVARTKYLAFRRMVREYVRESPEQLAPLDEMTRYTMAVFTNVEGWRAFFEKVLHGMDTSRRVYGLSPTPSVSQADQKGFLGTVMQIPFALRGREDIVEWTRLAFPLRGDKYNYHFDKAPRLRMTLDELKRMVEAGVPLWMAERFDTGQGTYPAEVVTEAYLHGYPDEFVWTLLEAEPA